MDMRSVRILLLRIRSLVRQRRMDRELEDELQFHLERQIEEYVASGMSLTEARLRAKRSLGGLAQIAEECRDTRRVTPLVDLARDGRYALRSLAKNRLFAAVAILTLAVGIGATTAIFSVVNGVLLRPLPYAEADRIVSLGTRATDTGREFPRLTGGDLIDLRATADRFDALSAYWGGEIGVQLAGTGEFAGVYFVEPSFFRAFSVAASDGRTFTPADREQAAVVARGFATRLFGSPDRALGKTLNVEDHAYEIVGVLPAGFAAPRATDVWLPLPPLPAIALNRTAFNFQAIARLAPGVSLEQAQAQLNALGTRLALAYPESNRSRTFSIVPLRDRLVAGTRSTLYLLLGAVLLVLLIACVNVANLLLARATTRSHEIALRAALGAGRWRIVRQLATESLLLAAVGGGLGVALAYAGTAELLRLAPDTLPRLNEVGIDWRVLAFAGVCSTLASLVFGLAPAWQAARVDPHAGLRDGSPRGAIGGRSSRLRAALVVGEVAMSFALAVNAGLLLRSFVALTQADLGFRPGSVLVVTAHRPASSQQEYVRVARFFSRMDAEFSSMPGVTAVGATMGLPTGQYGSNGYYSVEGRPALDSSSRRPHSGFGLASPGYFAALGVPLLRGRDFGDADGYDAPFVAIVNQALARETFPGEDPIGRRVRCGLDAPDKWMTIVGVVGDVRQDSPATPPEPQLYMPLQQHPYHANEVHVVLRTSVAPSALVPAVRARMLRLTPQTALRFATLDDMVGASIGTPRFRTYLVGGFAALALLLAMAGVYGVTAYLTAQRTREFGVRVALGAQRREVFALVLGRVARLAVLGLLLGAGLSVVGGRLVASLLFGLQPLDVATYAAALVLLASVAIAAAVIPAWQASRVDPISALRAE
jgi:putative ABC transport system permease protein